ncbi:trafficking protein particle complex subunit 2-like protein-like protein [Cladochytrium replicatum]|nr:trafficking protein particle complex subunit 2-like protein-like protein [Cladochytrium replicatum]
MVNALPVLCVAVIGKANNPLYIQSAPSSQNDLKFHYIAHTSCDVIEERVSVGAKNADLYLGLLYSMEDLAVYGYMTNTRIKFILILRSQDVAIKDADMKVLFKKIHSAYVNLTSNPFYDPDANKMITSKLFAATVAEVF